MIITPDNSSKNNDCSKELSLTILDISGNENSNNFADILRKGHMTFSTNIEEKENTTKINDVNKKVQVNNSKIDPPVNASRQKCSCIWLGSTYVIVEDCIVNKINEKKKELKKIRLV